MWVFFFVDFLGFDSTEENGGISSYTLLGEIKQTVISGTFYLCIFIARILKKNFFFKTARYAILTFLYGTHFRADCAGRKVRRDIQSFRITNASTYCFYAIMVLIFFNFFFFLIVNTFCYSFFWKYRFKLEKKNHL